MKCQQVSKNSCHHSKTTKTVLRGTLRLVKHNISIIHVFTMSLGSFNAGKLDET